MRRHWQAVLAIVWWRVFAVSWCCSVAPQVTSAPCAAPPTWGWRSILGRWWSPPRVLVLLATNMLPTGATRRVPGPWPPVLELTQLTQRHHMRVLITEPGLTSQDSRSVQLRAHLRVQCSYSDFVAFLDDLAPEPS
jgi:hypothetical protein